MNDIKGIIEDVEKSSLVSNKVIKKVAEIIGQEKWNDIYDEENDICTTTGELIITLKGIAEFEKENEELKEINEGYCRSRDRLISMGFPTFKDCKEYAEHLTKAREIIQTLSTCLEGHHTNSFEYEQIKQAEAFLSEVEE